MASVLLVDDEEAVCSFVSRLLTLHSHDVFVARDGAEALDRLERRRFDLLIIDRMMPGISGIEVVSAVRSSPQHAAMKILMLTATSLTREVDEAFRSGVDSYIVKPPNIDSLVEKIRSLVDKRMKEA